MSRRERLLGGSQAREGVQGLLGYASSCGIGQLVMQVRGRGLGHTGSSVKMREVVGGLSGPRGGSGAPRVCPELWNWAVSDASARTRLGPHDSITVSDNLNIDMHVSAESMSLIDYIESWRMKLWDSAYNGVFNGAESFKKFDSFKDYKGSMLAVKCLLYRYTCHFYCHCCSITTLFHLLCLISY